MKNKSRTKLTILMILSLAFGLSGCKTARTAKVKPPASQPIQVSGTELDPYNMAKIRTPESVRAYYIGPYIDPEDSRIRHDGHRVSVIDNQAEWNLNPSAPTAVPLGPVVAVSDPAKQTMQLSGELDSKIVQANTLIAALLEQNDELLAELKQKDQELDKISERVLAIENKQKKRYGKK